MRNEIVEKMDQLIQENDEKRFEELMSDLKGIVKETGCCYTNGLFSAVENITYGKKIKEKQELIRRYKKTYQELELAK